MLRFAAAFALILLTGPFSVAAEVRIGLFGLLRPTSIRVTSTDGARVRIDGRDAAALSAGESLDISTNGASLTVADRKGGRDLQVSSVRIAPSDNGVVEVGIRDQLTRRFRGVIEIGRSLQTSPGDLSIVLITELEPAVLRVVAAEFEGVREVEALKALSVVCRSFMVSETGRHVREAFDFCDTTHCQLFLGERPVEASTSATSAAVLSTKGEVLVLEGEPIAAYYSAVCGGVSATPKQVWGGTTYPYSYARDRCTACRNARNFTWRRTARASLVLAALRSARGGTWSPGVRLEAIRLAGSELVDHVVIREGSSASALSVTAFRRAIGDRLGWNTVLSHAFVIERRGDWFVFRGKGAGSHVGLCLAGARARAGAGLRYDQILLHYFPMTRTKELVSGSPDDSKTRDS